MFELLMLLVLPSEINPQEVGIKYLLKDKFVDHKSCEEYVKENDLQYTSGWDAWDSDPNSSFANAQVVYWIYRNPELIDSNGKSLNKSVAKVFSDLTLTNKEH